MLNFAASTIDRISIDDWCNSRLRRNWSLRDRRRGAPIVDVDELAIAATSAIILSATFDPGSLSTNDYLNNKSMIKYQVFREMNP
jgi:hypothetical protein